MPFLDQFTNHSKVDSEPRPSFTLIRQTTGEQILLVATADAWNYIHSSVYLADVGTREASAKNPNCYAFKLGGSKFLLDGSLELEPSISTTVVHKTTVIQELCSKRNTGLDRLIASSLDLYTLKKHVGYLIALTIT